MAKKYKNQQIDKFRGEFIGRMVNIEILLSKLLATYIAPDKMNYCEYMLGKMDMPKRIEIYKQILNKDKEPAFVNYTYNGLLKDLQEMQDIRNLFAHSLAEILFFGYKGKRGKYSKHITFRNSKRMDTEFFFHEAGKYEIKDHKNNLEKLDKIHTALFDVWYNYNRRTPSSL